ncbi:MAG: Uma2 family endonuclease, partial [Chloroflexi bacterium]|nr:Uma2 family endonuclease [Chloroflexota bacterium]
ALAGAGRQHNRLAIRIIAALVGPAGASGCEVFGSDMLLRAANDAGDVGYYPDVQVVCDPADRQERYTERPCLIVEVLSDSTRRIDRGEKLEVYTRLPSLETYLVVSPDQRRVERHWRDGQEWRLELILGEGLVPVPCLGVALSLDEMYGPAMPEAGQG